MFCSLCWLRPLHPAAVCACNVTFSQEDAARNNSAALRFVMEQQLTEKVTLIQKTTGAITVLPHV